jgi:aspartyl aminopeptidase
MSETDRMSLIEFLAASPTAAHAVSVAAAGLSGAGFEELSERELWSLDPGSRCFTTRNGTSLVAVLRGDDDPAESGFRMVSAHTDFPCLRLKPNPDFEAQGYRALRAEIYGGPILATWFDRDLGLAGRVWLRNESETMEERLFASGPLCRIPSLAIHLDRKVNEKGFRFNREDNLLPVCGVRGDSKEWAGAKGLVAAASGVDPDRVAAFAADLYDTHSPSAGGQDDCFILSGRLDNLAMCHAGLTALMDSVSTRQTCVLALFDSEEVGSRTAEGAGSNLLPSVLERLLSGQSAAGEGRQALFVALARSMMISTDGAHAVHPAFADRHEVGHRPVLNSGPVLKVNASMRYSTTFATAGYFRECADAAGAPVQELVMRNDKPCGSTIGPILSTSLGVPGVDVGNPMLSMHSIREMAGTADHDMMILALSAHFSGEISMSRWTLPEGGGRSG